MASAPSCGQGARVLGVAHQHKDRALGTADKHKYWQGSQRVESASRWGPEIFNVGAGANNMLQCIWFPAHGTQMAPHISSVSNHNRSNILHDNKIQSREKSSIQDSQNYREIANKDEKTELSATAMGWRLLPTYASLLAKKAWHDGSKSQWPTKVLN
ncbi:hypothetical protein JB92DRAFT_2824473 [Gautieria morchelliformis]|nr:hypothetical protein JB92DRAFT_2824473 [Gautieria morchelliformis]